MDIKKEIEDILTSTKREGMANLLAYMESSGFYTAPASTKYHGAEKGALAVHSLNVYYAAMDLARAWCGEDWLNLFKDSIAIVALLHDLGKAGQFGKPLYIESNTQPYKYNKSLWTLPHEIVSVVEASKHIKLTEVEQRAIAWHNGLYGVFKDEIKGNETPLYMVIHFADMWASRVIETVEKE